MSLSTHHAHDEASSTGPDLCNNTMTSTNDCFLLSDDRMTRLGFASVAGSIHYEVVQKQKYKTRQDSHGSQGKREGALFTKQPNKPRLSDTKLEVDASS